MQTYKVLVFLNRVKVAIDDDFGMAARYFKEKGLDVTFTFMQTDIRFGVKPYLSNIPGGSYGVDEEKVKADLKALNTLKPLDYHAVIFMWDKTEVQDESIRAKTTSWSNYGQIIPDTEFIQLVTAPYDDQVGWIWKSIAHEMIHSFFKRILRTGMPVTDPMDAMNVLQPDGTLKTIPYYKNDDPDARDGNFATAFTLLANQWDRVFKNPFSDALKPKLLPVPSKRRSGQKLIGPKFIVAHSTGNAGSTAQNNFDYYASTPNKEYTSVHVFVDDKGAIECIPQDEKAWHVSYGLNTDNMLYQSDANDSAIGVELCYGGSIDNLKAYENYTQYIADLCMRYSLDPYIKIVSHSKLDPTRRTDPESTLKLIGKKWGDFIYDVAVKVKKDKLSPSVFSRLFMFLKTI